MAASMESIAFCNIPSEADFLSITSGYSEDTVVVSCQRKLINVYNLSDQKSVKSWSLWHGVTLTSPVLWDPNDERFVTVVNNQDVRLWGKDNNDFDKSKKKQTKTKIFQVMSSENSPLIVLFSNGQVDFLDRVKEDHSDDILKTGDQIFWSKTLTDDSTIKVLFTVIDKDSVNLHKHQFDRDTTTWNHSVVTTLTTTESRRLQSCDCGMSRGTATVFFLWSDGQVECVALSSDDKIQTTSCKLPGTLKKGSITALNDFHIAVVGLENEGKESLYVYDTKFGLVKSWQSLPEKQLYKPQVCQLGDSLFVPCGTKLYMYKYKCEPVTIGNLLGSMKSADTTTVETVPEHHIWNTKNKDSKPNEESKFQRIFTALLTCPVSGRIHSKFKKFFKELIVEVQKRSNSHWLDASHMALLVQKLLEEQNYWAIHEIQQLIKYKCIPMSVIGLLFDCLIAKSEVVVLNNALGSLPNVPESCICKALSFFLQADEEKLPAVSEDSVKEDSGPISENRAAIINRILCLPYSDVFLLECLRKIPFKDAAKLLEYLCHLLKTRLSLTANDLQSEGKSNILDQVVDWLCLVLDAHITQFILSPDAHICILKVNEVVMKQIEFYEGLVTLQALLEQFKARSLLPPEKKMGQYCIEVLHVY